VFKVQALSLARGPYQPAARAGKVGRVWANVAAPKRNRAVAERCAMNARIDNPDAIIRVVVRS
jgi:hypothetical protein